MFKKVDHHQAVSETIGTILLVAITVLIAAIIAAYLMGLPEKVSETKTIAASAKRLENGKIVITYHGGADEDKVSDIKVNIDETRDVCDGKLTTTIGSSCEYSALSNNRYHIVVVAEFNDASQQVIYNELL